MEQTIIAKTSHSEQIGDLMAALAKAQGKITSAIKDKKNPFFKSSYADLAGVWEVCRDPLSANNLAVIQTIEGSKQEMFLVTWLGHSSNQWIKSKIPLFVMKPDPQALGSAITYARRYALSAMVGVCADDDDDGEAAMGRKSREAPSIDIEQYLDSWNEEKEGARQFLEAVMKVRKWDAQKTIQEFCKNPDETRRKYEAWKFGQKAA